MRLVIAVAFAVLLLASASSSSPQVRASPLSARGACRPLNSIRGPDRIESVIAAARRLVPKHYSNSRGFVILYASWLANRFGESNRFRGVAVAKCGARVTSLSWGRVRQGGVRG